MKYRLGLDVGTNSIGGALVELEDVNGCLVPSRLVHMFVRIFSDARHPKDRSSNAAQRRGPRSMRRNRDRKIMRRDFMLRALVKYGLMPGDKGQCKALERDDPWILRMRALDERLTPYQIGRALFHLQQRRGFQSNRKTDSKDGGKLKDGIEQAQQMMAVAKVRTLGELFGKRRLEREQDNAKLPKGQRQTQRLSRVRSSGEGAKLTYDFYPQRDMILGEFELIWAAQSTHHPQIMTDDAKAHLYHILSHQRPLKPQKSGKCTFLPEEPRAPKALPTAQYARILQEVNNLRVGATGEAQRALSPDEREKLIDYLMRPSSKMAKRTFKKIRKVMSLPESQIFSHETAKRDHLVGDLTAATMMQKDAYGPAWFDLSRTQQDDLISYLIESEQFDDWARDGEAIQGFGSYAAETFGLSEDHARAVFDTTHLNDGHGKLSKAALDRLMPHLEAGLRYDQAKEEEFKNSDLGDGEIHDHSLPYYGEILDRHTAFEKDDPKNTEEKYGKIANPTVHVALNEIGKLINDLIKRYGKPTQIVLELARDLPLSDRGLRELESRQKKNQDANDERRAELETMGLPDNYNNRLKLRLYEEAEKAFGGVVVCVFTGETINKTNLFTDNVEVEHILPLSRTLDDSIANKVLSVRRANREKKNRSPYEAFGDSSDGYDWEMIAQYARDLPDNKRWRFDPDAMQKWKERGGGDFLARHLNDTRYIARLGKKYVEALYGGQGQKGQSRQVWVVPGRLTSDLRHFAGLNNLTGLTGGNRKDRTDHRHHAVDALVIALTDQAMIKRAADLAKREDKVAHYEIMQAMAEPLKRYRNEAEDRLSKLVVSHKPDHGFQDAMHRDTALGITGEIDKKGQMIVVTRKAVGDLSDKDIKKIIDPHLRWLFASATEGLSGKAFKTALLDTAEAQTPTVKRIRVQMPKKETSLVTIKHGSYVKNGSETQHMKAYEGSSNYCYDIWMGDKGKWAGEVITTYQAYQMAQDNFKWWQCLLGRQGQELIMRLRKGDMLEIDWNGKRIIVLVYKFTAGAINMAQHYESNASKRIDAKELERIQMSVGPLQKANAVRVTVSPSGKVKRHKYKS